LLGNLDQHEHSTKQAFLLTTVLSSSDSNCGSLHYSRKATRLSLLAPLALPVGSLCEQFDNNMFFCLLAILFPNWKIQRYSHTGMMLSPLASVAAEAVVVGQPRAEAVGVAVVT
jgi:hypothetical protein